MGAFLLRGFTQLRETNVGAGLPAKTVYQLI